MDLNIFNYNDYRALLRDFYKRKKKENPKFSHRYIAKKVGFTSSSFFSQIIKVQSNISDRLIFRFAKLMKLNRQETEYFELLVKYNQAKGHEEQKFFYEKILSFHQHSARKLEARQYELLNKWYYIAIRQIISIYPFRGDYKELAKMVVPAIRPEEAKKAIELLKALNLIRKNAQGYFEWCEPSITTGEQSNAVGIQSYLLETLDLAKGALDRFPLTERSLSTLSLSVSEEGLQTVKEKIKQFRKSLLECAENDRDVDRVCHLNVQLFPMSRVISRRK
ncbi:MAG: TIGR02147 family protein [Fibrobacteria bacterium]|nr:TIGR02147 family protein [Fibrobacteria bacterium]